MGPMELCFTKICPTGRAKNIFVDPTLSTGRNNSPLNEKKEKLVFSNFGKFVPQEERIYLESSLTFYFYFIKGKINPEQKPLMTLIKKKRSAKHEFGSVDQVTYWEGTLCEVAHF